MSDDAVMDLLAKVHALTHTAAGDGFLLIQEIKHSLESQPHRVENMPLVALLPCLQEFVRAAHALADLDGAAWPDWWPKNWPEALWAELGT